MTETEENTNMRQIDNMSESELDVLRLKNMLPDKPSVARGDNSPFAPLHPSLKKCKCGNIMTKRELYKHFDDIRRRMKVFNEPAREFFVAHGEVPLRVDDPKLDLEQQLEASLAEQNIIPSGHRLDDNNTETPTL
jgi:hypothetical protein